MDDSILVPQVGQDLTEAKVIELNVNVGDIVKKGDIVAVVESEKASFEVESFSDGIVSEIPYEVGDTATVLTPLIRLGKPTNSKKSKKTSSKDSKDDNDVNLKKSKKHKKSVSSDSVVKSESTNLGNRSSPAARKFAIEQGVNINKIQGTGPNGAVVLRDIEKSANVDKQQISTSKNKIKLQTLREGNDIPVVFLHGFGSDLSSWRPMVSILQERWPIIALDLPGHGSSWNVSVDNFDELIETVGNCLQSLNSRIHIVGHSLGGAVAAALCKIDKLEVNSMTLIAPAGLGVQIDGQFIDGFLGAESEVSLASWMQRLVYNPKKLTTSLIEATNKARENTKLVPNMMKLASKLFEKNTQLFSVVDYIHNYDGPLTIIASKNDKIISFNEIAESIPANAGLHQLNEAGHLPHIEVTQLVANLINRTALSAG